MLSLQGAGGKQGLLLPYVSDTTNTGIDGLNPPDGMIIFFIPNPPDPLANSILIRIGGFWRVLISDIGGLPWLLNGNSSTNPLVHYIGTNDNVPLIFKTFAQERMRILPTGEIGINTAPVVNYSLTASGHINARWSATMNAGFDLDSKRFASAGPDTTKRNTYLGLGAGNIAISGTSNTLVGFNAGPLLTAASFNTLIGSRAGEQSITGAQNTYIGARAGVNQTAGIGNVYIGLNAGTGAFGGVNNGLSNVAIGIRPGFVLNNGSNNILLGYEAGAKITDGSFNTIIGAGAAQDLVTGSNNIVFGEHAGQNLVNGTDNIFIGKTSRLASAALQKNNSVAIGSNAVVNANNSVAIGNNSVVNADQAIVLGGTGADAVNVGIGTAAPVAPLHVAGNIFTESQLQFKSSVGIGKTTFAAGNQGATILNYTLPTSAPVADDDILSSTTTGILSWNTPAKSAWSLKGNTGTDPLINFLGTTDNQDLVFKTKANEHVRISAAGEVGMGVDVLPVAIANSGYPLTTMGRINSQWHPSTFGGFDIDGNRFISAGIELNAGNTLIGFGSGGSLTPGTVDNTAIGNNAGRNNIDGNGNSYLGAGAGFYRIGGNENTVIGHNAGAGSIGNTNNGGSNVLIGSDAGGSIADGYNNTMIGSGAGRFVRSGAGNILLGHNAAPNLIDGSGNIMLGESTGGLMNNENDNMLLGNYADISTLGINRSVAIGYNAHVGKDNAIVLGGLGPFATNVGIGTDKPSEVLHVVGNMFTENQLQLKSADGDGKTSFSAGNQGATNITYTLPAALPAFDGDMLSSTTTGILSWSPGKNVWSVNGNTGTTAGTHFLGTADAKDLVLKTSGIERMRFLAFNGEAGINAAPVPGYDLTVGSRINAKWNATNFSGFDINSTRFAWVGNDFSRNNTYLGFNAGNGTTTNSATDNTLIGNGAGRLITGGNLNTFLGSQAGYNNSTGQANTYAGYAAGSFQKTGYNNVFMGIQAGIGNNANTNSGHDNILIGTQTGSAIDAGTYNLVIGAYASQALTDGHFNVMVGTSAGSVLTTGTNNLGFGRNSAINLTTGHFNTFLGYQAGLTGSTQRSHSVAIGYNSKIDVDYGIALGGVGPEAVKVGIGTDVPDANLTVAGNVRLGNNGTLLNNMMRFTNLSITDLGTVTAGQTVLRVVTLPSAVAMGSTVYVSPDINLVSGLVIAYVRISAANTMTVAFTNATSADIPTTIPMGTFTVSAVIMN